MTFFSTEPFVKAWSAGWNHACHPISIRIGPGESRNLLYGIASPCGFGYARAEFGPDGLYASPFLFYESTKENIEQALRECERKQLIAVSWNVRFDHSFLASRLESAGLHCQVGSTHVLPIGKHDDLFRGYRQTRRNEIRKFYRRGAQIRLVTSYDDVVAYCRIHEKLGKQKVGFQVKYPLDLIFELVKLQNNVVLLAAEFHGEIIAGALFFLDGDSMLYWHAAADRDFAHLFAAGALIDKGVQIACAKSLRTFNFGGSSTDSLSQFKQSFGALPRRVWTFSIILKRPLLVRIKHRLSKIYAR